MGARCHRQYSMQSLGFEKASSFFDFSLILEDMQAASNCRLHQVTGSWFGSPWAALTVHPECINDSMTTAAGGDQIAAGIHLNPVSHCH